MTITVRFQESGRYDINNDCDVIRFMATTTYGSYWAEVQVEGPRALRRDREKFKSLVVDYIQAGSLPCEIPLGEEIEQ
jgi:hypothetical protein